MIIVHHAYLIIDPAGGESARLREEFAEKDFSYERQANFGIGEARELRARARREAAAGSPRYFMVETQSITFEAQNALLKMLEEPAAHTHFLIVLPSLESLLPTLLSRCEIVAPEILSELKYSELAQKFLAASPETRLKLVEKILTEAKDDEAATARNEAIAFGDALEAALYQSKLEGATRLKKLELVKQARSYLHDRAALPKLILEHLALVL